MSPCFESPSGINNQRVYKFVIRLKNELIRKICAGLLLINHTACVYFGFQVIFCPRRAKKIRPKGKTI